MTDPGRYLQCMRTLRDYAAKGCWEAQVSRHNQHCLERDAILDLMVWLAVTWFINHSVNLGFYMYALSPLESLFLHRSRDVTDRQETDGKLNVSECREIFVLNPTMSIVVNTLICSICFEMACVLSQTEELFCLHNKQQTVVD